MQDLAVCSAHAVPYTCYVVPLVPSSVASSMVTCMIVLFPIIRKLVLRYAHTQLAFCYIHATNMNRFHFVGLIVYSSSLHFVPLIQYELLSFCDDRTTHDSCHLVGLIQSVAWMSLPFVMQGHAGVTHLSPMEAREVSDPRKVVCVFGRSPDGLPHKVSRSRWRRL